MKNLEYTKMAYLYDKFYNKKSYLKEAEFIEHFIKNKNSDILDAGCGTGNHALILNQKGYKVVGFDKSKEMINLANQKLNEHFFRGDLLTFKSDKKYDLIYSFFAVFNHLKNYKEFKKALSNLKAALNDNGVILIDLHNPQKSGNKTEEIESAKRTMRWKKCNLFNKEYSKITFEINNNVYTTSHTFKIFNINKLKKIVTDLGFDNVAFYENYNIENKASKNSKNIQIVLNNCNA